MQRHRFLMLKHPSAAQAVTPAYIARILALTPVAYYPLNEASGAAIDWSGNSNNGTYTNALPGEIGIGDGLTSASFDGTGDFVDISAMQSKFNGNVGTLFAWANVSSLLANPTQRYIARVSLDLNNYVRIYKSAANRIAFGRTADSVANQINYTLSTQNAWFSYAMTWDTGSGNVIAFVNGASTGISSSISAFNVLNPATTMTLIGAGSTAGSQSWLGTIAHVAVFDKVLSDAQILSIGVL